MIFAGLLAFFTITDVMYYRIPNIVILPAILAGCILTGNWLAALIMAMLGAYLYDQEVFCGGDVKLLALAGAFIGVWALPAFILSRIAIWIYREIRNHHGVLPYAPFWAIGCTIVQLSRLVVTLYGQGQSPA